MYCSVVAVAATVAAPPLAGAAAAGEGPVSIDGDAGCEVGSAVGLEALVMRRVQRLLQRVVSWALTSAAGSLVLARLLAI